MDKQRLSCILRSQKFQSACNICAMAMFLLIVVIGSLPGAREDIGQLASGGVLHSIAYAVLGTFTFVGGKGNRSQRALGTVLKIAAMGAIDECVQSFFPYRTASVGDWLVDVTAGTLVSLILLKFWPVLTIEARVDA
jgi:hypothetical protein